MKQTLYVVRDTLTSRTDLFMEENDPAALRSFKFAINSDLKKAMFSSNYDLYKLGTYDNETLKIDLLDLPEMICKGSSVLEGSKDGN